MKIAQIRNYDVANGPGIRTTIFVTGCTHNCYNCFNVEYQDFAFGEDMSERHIEQLRRNLSKPQIKGLSILGGEPMQNCKGLISLLSQLQVQEKFGKSIWLWSGCLYEDIIKDKDKAELLSHVDVLVDGLFVDELKDLTLKYRGSSNQRVLHLKDSKIIEEE